MSNYATENLRTLALVGHGSCGKTTLIEAMLYRAGMIPEMGSIQRGTTMCDNDLLEKEVGHSIRLAVAHIDTAMTDLTPVRIHILDTRGIRTTLVRTCLRLTPSNPSALSSILRKDRSS